MSRAKDLFESVKKLKEEAIDRFIETRKAEELFLDFKNSANKGETKNLDDRDISNYEKAISGFGNSEGGIIVWGVDCRPDYDGVDVAKSRFPIKNPKRFESNLNNLTSGRTMPPHPQVENFSFAVNDSDFGFVVTYVPKSQYAPFQTIKSKDFYIRVGSSFEKAPYAILSGLFGKRPEPKIGLYLQYMKPFFSGREFSFELKGIITNIGVSIIRDLYAVLKVNKTMGKNCKLLFNPQVTPKMKICNELNSVSSLIAQDDFVFVPGALEVLFQLKLDIYHPYFPFKNDLDAEVFYGCEGGRINRFKLFNEKIFLNTFFQDELFLSEKYQNSEFTDGKKEHVISLADQKKKEILKTDIDIEENTT